MPTEKLSGQPICFYLIYFKTKAIMSDFWKKIKGVFVVEDPNAAKAESKIEKMEPTKATAAPTPASPTTHSPTQATVSVGHGQVNEKFMQVLAGAMESANLPGFDYFEFKQSLVNLANMPMDEATRYKSAFAMATTMGATAPKLVESAEHYLNVLKTEEAKFLQAADNQRNAQIGNRKTQADNLENVIQQKAEQIKKLTQEIEQHRHEVLKIKDEIGQSTLKVEQTKKDFEATYQVLISQIQSDLQNMKNYLK
jgi:hypothetical protein